MSSSTTPQSSVEARLEIPQGICVLTYSDLNTQEIIDLVRDDAAGAIATFIGTFSSYLLPLTFRRERQGPHETLSRVSEDDYIA